MSTKNEQSSFSELNLSQPILTALQEIGYEVPTAIQKQCISYLLSGNDIIGQAQTGTGKTAAFALPLLDKIDLNNKSTQLLVLAPTRELAIQVAEAIKTYARNMRGFNILPIYGGQSYDIQLKQLKRGVHAVVGTPGRIMDHIKRKTLKLDQLQALVLDEADEMLRMGFIDDVKWVLNKIPEKRQIALFSATMPEVINKVAKQFLNNPKIVKIKTKTATATTIEQKYWLVGGVHKLDALTRILEVEEFTALIIFVRTKTATTDLAEKLSARGFSAAAINGDIQQNQRERIISSLKSGKLDILVATDVAARGLDVERISHVINYDIPHDPESYVHRIGRTGRAGRTGKAILFVAPRERRMLKSIERVTRQPIEPMQLPSSKIINTQRIETFKRKITDTISNQNLDTFQKIITEYQAQNDLTIEQIAAALALMSQGGETLLLNEDQAVPRTSKKNISTTTAAQPLKKFPQIPMRRFTIEVGHNDNVKPANIIGAIANEADIDSCYIGAIKIFDSFSTIDLPDEMPKETFNMLKNIHVCGKKLNIDEMKQTKKKTFTRDKSNKTKKTTYKKSTSPNKSRSRRTKPKKY